MNSAGKTLATLATILLCAGLIASGGCAIATLAGGMAESYRRSSERTVGAEYTDLTGKTFAVFVAADRIIQSEHPQLIPSLTNSITNRLATNANTAGAVPPAMVLQFQYNNPRWAAMSYADLAERFGVDRIIFVDIFDHRLYETGNSYLWDGVLAGQLGVVEADGPLPDDFAFTRNITVRFPDGTGFGPGDFSAAQVRAALHSRFVDRTTWLFYEHKEPYYPKY